MPQIQVLGREAIEDRNNIANQALERQKIVQDTWYKSQMLRYYADELKTKVQISQDEVKKAEMTQKYNDAKLGADVMDNAYKIAEKMGGKAAQDYLMGVQQQSPQLFSGIMSSGFGEKLSKLKPSGTERLNEAAARIVEQQVGGAPVEGEPSTEPGPISRINAMTGVGGSMGGGWTPGEINAGPIKLINPQQQIALEREKSAASARGAVEGKRAESAEDLRNNLDLFFDLDDAIKRGEGFPSRMAEGLRSSIAALNQGDPYGAIVKQRNDSVKYLRTALARIRDVGNLTKDEQESAEKLVAGIFESETKKQLGKAFLYDALDAMEKKEPTRIKALLKKYAAESVKKKAIKVGKHTVEIVGE